LRPYPSRVTLPAGRDPAQHRESDLPTAISPQNIGRQHRSRWTHNWGGFHGTTHVNGMPGDNPRQVAHRFAGASRRVYADMFRDLKTNFA
jgi:hypothetical protein